MREHPNAIDGVLVLALLIFPGLMTLNQYSNSTGDQTLVLVLLLTVPLVWRRSHPVASAAVVFLTAFLQWLFTSVLPILDVNQGGVPSELTVFIALYSVAAYGSRRTGRLALVFALVGTVLEAGVLTNGPGGDGLIRSLFELSLLSAVGTGLTMSVWVAGSLRGTRRAYLDAMVERARRLEIEREQQAQLAAAAERARIARELHDVVAHSLSVIISQADGGRYAARSSPQSAVDALEVVATTGRSALTEMRRLLGVLRESNGAERAPQPDVTAVPDLVTSVRDSGLAVSFAQIGQPRRLGEGIGLAAYRIVQEALTNVLKHAGPDAKADVRLLWEAQGLRVVIEDDGRGAAADGDGHGQGILGMRERAQLYGGGVQAGPRSGGGFRVEATLAYPAAVDPGADPPAPSGPQASLPPQASAPPPQPPVAQANK